MVFSIFRSKKTVDELAKESGRRVTPKTDRVAPEAKGEAAPSPSPEQAQVQEELESFGLEKSEFEDDYAPLEFHSSSHEAPSETAIEVVESTESVDPVVEQAAMLYAGGQTRETVALLEDVLRADPSARIEIWLMLFELYTLQDTRNLFEELAIKFAEKFTRSAPDWDADVQARAPQKKPKTENKVGSGYFSFPPVLTEEATTQQLQQFDKQDVKSEPIRIEFAKVQDIDGASATLLLEWLKKKTNSPRQWLGLESLSKVLAGKYEVMRLEQSELPYWLLQLEILQLLGLQEEFENAAVDYAVTFEVSPPSWDARKVNQQIAAAPVEPEVEPEPVPQNADEDLFSLEGVIADGKGDQLTAMRLYAARHQHIRLDMKKVIRMDFSSAGWLLNMLIAFQQEGKQITITGAGELLIGLFRVLGITELAQVVRRR